MARCTGSFPIRHGRFTRGAGKPVIGMTHGTAFRVELRAPAHHPLHPRLSKSLRRRRHRDPCAAAKKRTLGLWMERSGAPAERSRPGRQFSAPPRTSAPPRETRGSRASREGGSRPSSGSHPHPASRRAHPARRIPHPAPRIPRTCQATPACPIVDGPSGQPFAPDSSYRYP